MEKQNIENGLWYGITENEIDIGAMINWVRTPRSGAVVMFSGEARNHHEGKAVESLEYESQIELANQTIEKILKETIDKWKIERAGAVHRIGPVGISQSAVVVVTSSAHRKEAYAANKEIIDRIKEEVPVWKKELFTEGGSAWQ